MPDLVHSASKIGLFDTWKVCTDSRLFSIQDPWVLAVKTSQIAVYIASSCGWCDFDLAGHKEKGIRRKMS